MILLRFIPILLAFTLALPGYAAEAIMLPAQEESPANFQQIEQTEPEKASEEPEQELEFLETTKGKAVTLAAILASLGLGTGFYFYLKKMREKKEKQEQERQEHEQRFEKEQEQQEEQKRAQEEREEQKKEKLERKRQIEEERKERLETEQRKRLEQDQKIKHLLQEVDDLIVNIENKTGKPKQEHQPRRLPYSDEETRLLLRKVDDFFNKPHIFKHSQREPLNTPVRKALKYLTENPESIKEGTLFSNKKLELSGKEIELAPSDNDNYIIIKQTALNDLNETAKRLNSSISDMSTELNLGHDHLGLGIDKRTGNLMLMYNEKIENENQGQNKWVTVQNIGKLNEAIGQLPPNTKFDAAIQTLDTIDDLNKKIEPKAGITPKSSYKDIDFIFPD